MSQADIGLIGLGVMGENLALNIADNGYKVAVYNRTADKVDSFLSGAGDLSDNVMGSADLAKFVSMLKRPRSVIIMVKAGGPVDSVIEQLKPLLEKGDVIIDAGNANYHDTVRRFAELDGTGIGFLGIGVSGGEEGARHGPSIMVGGSEDEWHNAEDVLNAIAAKFDGESCCAYLGTGGAGHFVKTIHNGIEYADMQMIAEIYGVMRDGLGMSPAECADVFREWNKGPLDSYLIEISSHVLDAVDEESGKPLLDIIVDQAGQKGTGRWSAIEALNLGVSATTIEGAVAARSISAMKDERIAGEKLYGAAPKGKAKLDLKTLEKALLAGKIAAYAQGFAVMAKASEENGWNLPLDQIAKIWRAGCIIRSRFLDTISQSFASGTAANLLTQPAFVEMMKDSNGALREVVAGCAMAELPTPCLSSALAYFDGYRQANGTTNLTQGQRDFFGAHGFKRYDKEGDFHHSWPSLIEK
ncbi:NADP-dependent phosphogluconate dehydrogenase [Pelagibacterium lentulum]|uniref:6-phosphogluconate dehydrogenase, decarboxylating n=1 Tax=Pelagibacterium lentulum TaxID=2029865 RepID=A0A916W228_9HYPH|nr:NADP-dependent phosphogluconate dehydrogenase [Pelagibacterium lentulum]GGA60871.1 6-phosphogluconate dehydrogenase, decarboxylating [Pelagibacterium lentulum]